jgi:hypothetical protein
MRENMFATVQLLLELHASGKAKENDRASLIQHTMRCEDRGYRHVY